MAEQDEAGALGPLPSKARRSSLFEIGRPSVPLGSSVLSCSHEPHQEEVKQRKVSYENTYCMEPPQRFRPGPVQEIIQEVLEGHLKGTHYSPITCNIMSKALAQEIKHKVKLLDIDRYRIVVVVNIGQKKDQDVRIGSRCVWDSSRDNFASAFFESAHLFATGTVFAVYYE
ncbi:PREDICTED: tctex1 domain-containing protein 1-like [Priapulus caudatus]|uniref:Tctex1 domain-containing protein 1-like n=1 Tax=Priapulus caudatus TaxID=37621 RepID=A0ABM1EJ53_PRICU|nr:PREDICTED: tctex1 domain-containing protein 1-like [Priapulus caudatus]